MDRSCIANVAPFGQNNIGKEKEHIDQVSPKFPLPKTCAAWLRKALKVESSVRTVHQGRSNPIEIFPNGINVQWTEKFSPPLGAVMSKTQNSWSAQSPAGSNCFYRRKWWKVQHKRPPLADCVLPYCSLPLSNTVSPSSCILNEVIQYTLGDCVLG